jgi:hypothetical protein
MDLLHSNPYGAPPRPPNPLSSQSYPNLGTDEGSAGQKEFQLERLENINQTASPENIPGEYHMPNANTAGGGNYGPKLTHTKTGSLERFPLPEIC